MSTLECDPPRSFETWKTSSQESAGARSIWLRGRYWPELHKMELSYTWWLYKSHDPDVVSDWEAKIES